MHARRGHECSSWDGSVDHANLDALDYGDVPGDKFVRTTWHDKEPLSELLWFAAHGAAHSDVPLDLLVLVDIARNADESGIMEAFAEAASG